MPSHARAITLALAISLISRAGHAEPPRDPKDDPQLSDPSIDQSLLEQQRRPAPKSNAAPLTTSTQPSPVPAVHTPPATLGTDELAGVDYRLPAPTIYPEGTFISALAGVLVPTATNDFVVVPVVASTEPRRIAPFVLLPNQKLDQLATLTSKAKDKPTIEVAGQVFVYRDRMYLLLSSFSLAPRLPFDESTPPSDDHAEPKPDENPPTTATPTMTPDTVPPKPKLNPNVDDIIKSLESAGNLAQPRTSRPQSSSPTTTDATPTSPTSIVTTSSSALREGQLVTRRRGRMVRGQLGGVAFVVDNDPDSPAMAPVGLLPCRLLEEMERVTGERGERLALRLSGQVTTSQGKTYLLPTMFQIAQPSQVRPLN